MFWAPAMTQASNRTAPFLKMTLGRPQLRDGLQNERLLFKNVEVMKMGKDLGNALEKE